MGKGNRLVFDSLNMIHLIAPHWENAGTTSPFLIFITEKKTILQKYNLDRLNHLHIDRGRRSWAAATPVNTKVIFHK